MVKAGYVEWENRRSRKTTFLDFGVPQGGITSPILSNLVLNELDQYIEEIVRKGEGVKRRRNPKYERLTRDLNVLRKKMEAGKECGILPLKKDKELKREIIKKRHGEKMDRDPSVCNIKYVRYADDWVIGV